MGSVFGGCTCSGPLTDGIPCHHMIAVLKSSRIKGLNDNNAIPQWWTAKMWHLQYPKDTTVLCDFGMNSLKDNHAGNTTIRYCPPYVAASRLADKRGRRSQSVRVWNGILRKLKN